MVIVVGLGGLEGIDNARHLEGQEGGSLQLPNVHGILLTEFAEDLHALRKKFLVAGSLLLGKSPR